MRKPWPCGSAFLHARFSVRQAPFGADVSVVSLALLDGTRHSRAVQGILKDVSPSVPV